MSTTGDHRSPICPRAYKRLPFAIEDREVLIRHIARPRITGADIDAEDRGVFGTFGTASRAKDECLRENVLGGFHILKKMREQLLRLLLVVSALGKRI